MRGFGGLGFWFFLVVLGSLVVLVVLVFLVFLVVLDILDILGGSWIISWALLLWGAGVVATA